MAFPEAPDRELIAAAESLAEQAADLTDWMMDFGQPRRDAGADAISDGEASEAIALRRMADSLYNAARVPAAAAVYGPSQVGKSLFIGRVLDPLSAGASPLGRDEQLGPPGYFQGLSFTHDLNPQSGSNEATALVTRFTTKDRMRADVPGRFPVLVRSLTRSQWMRVLARGFMAECRQDDTVFDESKLESIFASCESGDGRTPRDWRNDVLDTYQYVKQLSPLRYPADEAFLSGLLARYPLSDGGCVSLGSALFWDRWRSLTSLFVRVSEFLERVRGESVDGIVTHWAGVRFLLDSQRAGSHHDPASTCFDEVRWEDLRLVRDGSWQTLDYEPDRGHGGEDLATIQASMLEMVIPILPHRISEAWRKVLAQFDLLDIPGMRAGREGGSGGLRESADSLEEQMEIVKRGKVQFLFERYIEERQIQTLLLLTRGGNLEVRGQMKAYVDRWGKLRYGDSWPESVHADRPALFLGMTGIDEEFRHRSSFAGPELYDNRLRQLSDTLQPILDHFGGRDRPFQNVFPLRYPGTWDADRAGRQAEGEQKWEKAGDAFVRSKLVAKYVASPGDRWQAAMRDEDGGLSLISEGFRAATDNAAKRASLERSVDDLRQRIRGLATSWVVPPDANFARDRRIALAHSCLRWLVQDREAVLTRFGSLRDSLCLQPGDTLAIADFAELRWDERLLGSGTTQDRLARLLREFLDEWSQQLAPSRWHRRPRTGTSHDDGFTFEDFQSLASYLRDYLVGTDLFDALVRRLCDVVNLRLRDEAAARQARRKYTSLLLNDAILYLGPPSAWGMPSVRGVPTESETDLPEAIGPLWVLVRHWQQHLAACLACGAGDETIVPPGNRELCDLIGEWA